jgi:hypothetical protein
MSDLNSKWNQGTLTRDDIAKYAQDNLCVFDGDASTVSCAADNCYRIYLWSQGHHALGDFLQAVVRNDLSKAVKHADTVNLRALTLTVKILFNIAPMNLVAYRCERTCCKE